MADEETLPGSADAAPTRALAHERSISTSHPKSSLPPATPVPEGATLDLPKPESVLHRSEVEQTRRTSISGVIFNGFGILVSPLLGGDPLAYACFVAGLIIAFANNALLWFVSANERRYHQRWVVLYFCVAPFSNALILYYVGVFGPLVAMFVLNIYTACLAYDERVARVTLVASILPPTVVGGAMAIFGLPDPGLISAGPLLGALEQGVFVFGIGLFLVLTYAQARASRELLVASLVDRDAAVRTASHREALFLEARQDLERALQAGGLGRFSDHTLGSFRLGAVLGRGGMGEVYEATHVHTGEPVAVKMLRTDVLGHPDYVRRFLREVHVAAAIESPHVVRVLEVGDESAPMPYLAMERLLGEDLGQILRKRERLDHVEVLELVRQVGRGVEAAHRAGVVHRDLKPQNLFRTLDDPAIWKILDFGISKPALGGDTLTQGDAIGTPHYMAPEQARGRPVDARTDLYALGAIVYRALTGHQPFAGEASAAVLVKVLAQMPARPSALADLPAEIDLVLAVALAKRPEDRFPTANDLDLALTAAFAGKTDATLRRRARSLLARLPWTEPA